MKTYADTRDELKILKKKLENLNIWISQNTRSPHWLEKVSERNSLTVKIESQKQQLRSDWNTRQHPVTI